MENLVEKYQKKEYISEENNIIQLFKDCKKKDLLPMLYFHTKEEVAKEIFLNFYRKVFRKPLVCHHLDDYSIFHQKFPLSCLHPL